MRAKLKSRMPRRPPVVTPTTFPPRRFSRGSLGAAPTNHRDPRAGANPADPGSRTRVIQRRIYTRLRVRRRTCDAASCADTWGADLRLPRALRFQRWQRVDATSGVRFYFSPRPNRERSLSIDHMVAREGSARDNYFSAWHSGRFLHATPRMSGRNSTKSP